ncbi:MAG: hypothetical protein A2075_18540 [Geobacteraceae bacterium GWC2_58_44]|nr:MAG: hypothetical protein A2075_18540 [Geobacteraceae bacterium GWC2_58_44]HBG04001.1 hypothetical protein [Geobacter sp.]
MVAKFSEGRYELCRSLFGRGVDLCSGLATSKVKKETNRNRVQQAFIAGIVRSISDYQSATDRIRRDEIPDKVTSLPIPYPLLLENIDYELNKTLFLGGYEKWLKGNRHLFEGEDCDADGFNFMYYDLFDSKLVKWDSKK